MARPGSNELLALQGFLAPLCAHRLPGSNLPKKEDLPSSRWRVYCGNGRFNWSARNGLILRDGSALNFQASGDASGITEFEAGIFWPTRWALMLHVDGARAHWPLHPERHFQFEGGDGPAPFIHWRLPAEGDLLRWIAYLAVVLTAK